MYLISISISIYLPLANISHIVLRTCYLRKKFEYEKKEEIIFKKERWVEYNPVIEEVVEMVASLNEKSTFAFVVKIIGHVQKYMLPIVFICNTFF